MGTKRMQPGSRPLISVLAVGSALLLWWVVGHWRLADPVLLPGPEEVALTGYDLVTEGYRGVSLVGHLAISVARALAAFALAVLTGIPLGIAMGMSPTLNAIFDPFVQFLRPLPKLALIPLVVVWFGIGEFSKVLLIYLATFLTVVVAATAAVMSVPEGRLRAARSLGVNRWQLFRHVILPSALPELFTGVRVGIGIGWTTLIAAEMIASTSGLGWMVMNASAYLRTDVVMLGVLMLGVTGYLLDFALVSAQRRWVHWMGKA
jgi:taurine transport system permease protein